MDKTLYVLFSVVMLNSHFTGGEGNVRPGYPGNTTAAVARAEKGNSGPLAYAIAVNAPATSTTQFGILDIGTGAFHLNHARELSRILCA